MAHRSGRTAFVAFLVLAGSLILPLAGGATAQAAAKPAPIDPGPAAVAGRADTRAALPEMRRNPGLKAMLSEKDADRGNEAPGLSALCQKGVGHPNPYRKVAPNVDQIVGDTIVKSGSQTGCSAAQNENTIAVNPANPNNLVAGTNDYRIFNTREQRNDSSG